MKIGDIIELSHGGGGQRMDVLIKYILEIINQEVPDTVHFGSTEGDDGAMLELTGQSNKIVLSTDSHTVYPLFFRGGNLGDLSIVGTINDVVCMGAKPEFLTLGLIIEEGFAMDDLRKIVESMAARLKESGAIIVSGDTKVMPKGHLSGLVTNTAGYGRMVRDDPLSIANAREGDKIIISGPIGDHGASLMSLREGIDLDTDLLSDVIPFWPYMEEIIRDPRTHVVKDLTRGGLASAMSDIATASKKLLEIDEVAIPIRDSTQAVCDILGLEVMEISSEGKAVIFVAPEFEDECLKILHGTEFGRDAHSVGQVKSLPAGAVHIITEIGGTRLLAKPFGEPIPRVC